MSEANDLSKDGKSVDVSTAETHFSIQCEDIRLVSSLFRLFTEEDKQYDSSRFTFKISAFVQGNQAYSHLDTQVIYLSPEESEETQGYVLRFGLVARFAADEEISPEEMGGFVKFYTLSILWPYAREYAGDQLRRAGEDCLSLPIINPQVVTERLVEDDLVQVEIIGNESE